ncbi:hypothetical protein FISHEDRAFT_70891 [Fistulina hepatica ATCC 64428]|uniref:Uncharacterized protein n=1 Tax=Fistulina hepatica ATCC 64428 TaxID=1128425 RepID=A0A0D7AKE2_9AGAR|nr:hypothetical protein FISHEDRAFT_70891 [Fistulina hepatica ATCC 64428]
MSQAQTLPTHNFGSSEGHESWATSSSGALWSALSSSTALSITPAMIEQIDRAAASNSALSSLLFKATKGLATPPELSSLGTLVEQIIGPSASQPVLPTNGSAVATSSGPFIASLSAREFDLVFEFCEAPGTFRIFPRGPVICKQLNDTLTSICDISITAVLSVPVQDAEQSGSSSPQILHIRLTGTSLPVWDTLKRWMGDEHRQTESLATISKLKADNRRIYLRHKLADEALLFKIQAACKPPYSMVSIKPGSTTRTGTRQRRRTTTTQKTSQKNADAAPPIPSFKAGQLATVADAPRPTKRSRSGQLSASYCESCRDVIQTSSSKHQLCRRCLAAGKRANRPPVFKFSSYNSSLPAGNPQIGDVSAEVPFSRSAPANTPIPPGDASQVVSITASSVTQPAASGPSPAQPETGLQPGYSASQSISSDALTTSSKSRSAPPVSQSVPPSSRPADKPKRGYIHWETPPVPTPGSPLTARLEGPAQGDPAKPDAEVQYASQPHAPVTTEYPALPEYPGPLEPPQSSRRSRHPTQQGQMEYPFQREHHGSHSRYASSSYYEHYPSYSSRYDPEEHEYDSHTPYNSRAHHDTGDPYELQYEYESRSQNRSHYEPHETQETHSRYDSHSSYSPRPRRAYYYTDTDPDYYRR